MIGNGTGRTVTVKVQLFVPQEFVATHVTVEVPIGKQKPDGGLQKAGVPLATVGNG
jgi:hypothetical protein